MKRFIILFFAFIIVTIIACEKQLECYTVPVNSCYDAEMALNHSGVCLNDCPGVYGCDGKFYCNSCDASRAGISVVSLPVCE
ncbi:MAG: hypothetical protein ACPGR5_07790 [Chitinophagales bacterium]